MKYQNKLLSGRVSSHLITLRFRTTERKEGRSLRCSASVDRYKLLPAVAMPLCPWFTVTWCGYERHVHALFIFATISYRYHLLGFIYPLLLFRVHFSTISYLWTNFAIQESTISSQCRSFANIPYHCVPRVAVLLSISLVQFRYNVDALSVFCTISFQKGRCVCLFPVTCRIKQVAVSYCFWS